MLESPSPKRKKLDVERGVFKKPITKTVKIKKIRKRTRTATLRREIVEKIECALRSEPCPISHLFTSLDESGTPKASLSAILSVLVVDNFSKLSPQGVISLNRFTHMFSVHRECDKYAMDTGIRKESEFSLTYRPATVNSQDCTVYLDNLPSNVNRDRLLRELRKFGTVVQIRIPTRPRRVSVDTGFKPLPRPRGFAFVKFTEPEAVAKICQEYISNVPLTTRRKTMNRIILLKERRIRRKENAHHSLSASFNNDLSLNNSFASKSSNGEIVETKERLSITPSPRKRTHQESEATRVKEGRVVTKEKDGEIKKKKRRKRKRKDKKQTTPTSNPAFIEGPVRKFFQKMQAMPFSQYRDLRVQYLESQRKIRAEARNSGKIANKKFTALCAERDANWTL